MLLLAYSATRQRRPRSSSRARLNIPRSPSRRLAPASSNVNAFADFTAPVARPMRHRMSPPFFPVALVALASALASASASASASCARVGARSRSGCDDAVRASSAPFDVYELARSWAPGYCFTTSCESAACSRGVLEPTLTLHGLWPSYAAPIRVRDRDSARRALRTDADERECFWPQNCARPRWYPSDEAWAYDATEAPSDDAAREIAPAWTSEGLGAHEWAKHGTCASWGMDSSGDSPGYTQREYYAATFALAEALGTPRALTDAAGSEVALTDLQDAFGGSARVAFGCTRDCELVQVVQCFARAADGGVGSAMDCPCVGVLDSRYDNSCAGSCERVRVLSPEQSKCAGRALVVDEENAKGARATSST